MLNNVRGRKETLFGPKKFNLSKYQKSPGVNPCFWSKNVFFFLELFSVKIRLEMMFNNALDTKETCFSHKKIQSFHRRPKLTLRGKGVM